MPEPTPEKQGMPRVLLVLPMYGGSLPVGRFAAEGLRENGCLVEIFNAPAFHPVFCALKELKVGPERLDALQNSFLQHVSQCVTAKAEAFAPDLVLSLAQAPLSIAALKRLRRAGLRTAMWFVEDFRIFTYWRAFAPYYDLFAVIQKEPFIDELDALGVHDALYLPLAALPSLHRPLTLDEREKQEFGSQLSFVGAGYPNRRKAFAGLRNLGLKIWGTEWDDDPEIAPMLQKKGERITSEDCVRIFNAAAVNINLHSSVRADPPVAPGDFVNPRTFEIAACGAFQLTDRRGLLPELYGPDEAATFSDLDELREKILYYSAHPEERAAVAARARRRTLAEHTYAARMKRLLDFAAERLPGFMRREDIVWPQNMPAELGDAVAALIRELGLSANASFSDVIAAVRGKSGVLSDAEAALLFLDEWKKLYT
ncbi:MAG: glycosyltransferase [Desulfovibrio sp.]|jgi:spore maturation protein CgeB|nr:glycosyltransferase [Desulfovibrio sp.]